MQTRSQLIEAAENVCTLNQSDNRSCNIRIQVTVDQLSCYDDNRLIYVAGVNGTEITTAASFLEYLGLLGPVEISLDNQTFSIMSSPSCPLSIPSAEESNCNRETKIFPTSTSVKTSTSTSTVSTTITATSDATTHVAIATTTASTTPSTITTTTNTNVISIETATDDDDNATDKNDTVVVVVTIASLVGIVVLTFGIILFIVICHQCNRYRHHSNK